MCGPGEIEYGNGAGCIICPGENEGVTPSTLVYD